MKKGDTVILNGEIIDVLDDGYRMNYLIAFQHKTKDTTRFIEYWFSDVFLQPAKAEEGEK